MKCAWLVIYYFNLNSTSLLAQVSKQNVAPIKHIQQAKPKQLFDNC